MIAELRQHTRENFDYEPSVEPSTVISATNQVDHVNAKVRRSVTNFCTNRSLMWRWSLLQIC